MRGRRFIYYKEVACEVCSMKHIVLLGDSIFDNKSYVRGGADVVTHLRRQIPQGWSAELRAIDGSVVRNVSAQLARVPAESTHLIVSVGGNDALANADMLNARVSSSAEVFNEMSNRSGQFEKSYREMLRSVLDLGRPVAACSIYYPRMDDMVTQKVAVAALATFNDVIIKQAFLAGVPLIDLRLVCSEDSDYANEIEPSESGGEKIARSILKVVNEHDFSKRKTEVFF
jgi:hypothetical protein